MEGLCGIGAGQELAGRTRRTERLVVALGERAVFRVEKFDGARDRYVRGQTGDSDNRASARPFL